MLLHEEAYRVLARERLNQYLGEAAADRRIRVAVAVDRKRSGTRPAAAWLLRAVVRALSPNSREKRPA